MAGWAWATTVVLVLSLLAAGARTDSDESQCAEQQPAVLFLSFSQSTHVPHLASMLANGDAEQTSTPFSDCSQGSCVSTLSLAAAADGSTVVYVPRSFDDTDGFEAVAALLASRCLQPRSLVLAVEGRFEIQSLRHFLDHLFTARFSPDGVGLLVLLFGGGNDAEMLDRYRHKLQDVHSPFVDYALAGPFESGPSRQSVAYRARLLNLTRQFVAKSIDSVLLPTTTDLNKQQHTSNQIDDRQLAAQPPVYHQATRPRWPLLPSCERFLSYLSLDPASLLIGALLSIVVALSVRVRELNQQVARLKANKQRRTL